MILTMFTISNGVAKTQRDNLLSKMQRHTLLVCLSFLVFYCFPKTEGDIVCKVRLAAEEIYKIRKGDKKAACACQDK